MFFAIFFFFYILEKERVNLINKNLIKMNYLCDISLFLDFFDVLLLSLPGFDYL